MKRTVIVTPLFSFEVPMFVHLEEQRRGYIILLLPSGLLWDQFWYLDRTTLTY